jgi:hypothetical protein
LNTMKIAISRSAMGRNAACCTAASYRRRAALRLDRVAPIGVVAPHGVGKKFVMGLIWPVFDMQRVNFPEGHHGNAVLSRFPIEYYENRDISVGNGEKRGLRLPLVGTQSEMDANDVNRNAALRRYDAAVQQAAFRRRAGGGGRRF